MKTLAADTVLCINSENAVSCPIRAEREPFPPSNFSLNLLISFLSPGLGKSPTACAPPHAFNLPANRPGCQYVGARHQWYNKAMSRHVPFRPLALSFLILVPAPFFALLCRGHSPSRFETANLPVWERRPPTPAPPSRFFRLIPPPPGTVQLSDNPWLRTLLRADENRLLTGIERPGTGDAGAAGDWLEAACAWGREPAALAAKQDRVAIRLLAAQAEDGTFGLPSEHAAEQPIEQPWSPPEAAAQRSCLRGLLAYYAVSRQPAAIHAALTSGDRIVGAARELPSTAWVYPLARLSQEADDPRFLAAARQQAAVSAGLNVGESLDASKGLGLCALYEVTGRAAYLAWAQQAWAHTPHSPALAAELLLLTGRPGYAAALDRLPPAGPALARAAWTRAPLGLAVNTDRDLAAVFHSFHLNQRTGRAGRTITVGTAMPAAARLRVFLPPGPPVRIWINGVAQATPAPPGGYALLARRWRNGDRVEIRPDVSQTHPAL